MDRQFDYCPLCLTVRSNFHRERREACREYVREDPTACMRAKWKKITADAPPEVLAEVALHVMNPDPDN